MGFRTLIVCDELASLEVLFPALRDLGMSPEVCTEMDAARELVTSTRLDAVILDVDGMETAAQILPEVRSAAFNKRCVAIALLDETPVHEAFARGAIFVLHKPLEPKLVATSLAAAQRFMLDEQRHTFRQPLNFEVKVRCGTGKHSFDARNVSEGGMGLGRTRRLLKPQEKVSVSFQLPDVKDAIEAQAEVIWINPDDNAGLRFLQVSQQRALRAWISEKYERSLEGVITCRTVSLPPSDMAAAG